MKDLNKRQIIFSLLLFGILNAGALALGGIFTGKGVPSAWNAGLAKAPWTPPGWVFGAAWTTIMVCFTIYMAVLWSRTANKKTLLILFSLQWVLNVAWNPVFFYYHQVFYALLVILALTLLVGLMIVYYRPVLKLSSLWLMPYLLWLFIAVSLNWYIWIKN